MLAKLTFRILLQYYSQYTDNRPLIGSPSETQTHPPQTKRSQKEMTFLGNRNRLRSPFQHSISVVGSSIFSSFSSSSACASSSSFSIRERPKYPDFPALSSFHPALKIEMARTQSLPSNLRLRKIYIWISCDFHDAIMPWRWNMEEITRALVGLNALR
jgi:hypothetical protein